MLTIGNFIELDRRFSALGPSGRDEAVALDSYTRPLLGREPGLNWNDLVQNRLVVILGEAGSGKTWEFRYRARLLSAGGQFSFFIRLDEIATQPLQTVLRSDEIKPFQKWLSSDQNATFFLDSVDEAKFSTLSEFYVALDKLRDGIGRARLTRARFLFSSRISEWQPQTDAIELMQRFALAPPSYARSRQSTNDHEPALKERLLIVEIEPLDRIRVELFVRSIGLENPDEFIVALDEANAWEFARRPIDVIGLANYWGQHKRLGSLATLIEYDVESNLRPSVRDRDDCLSSKQAREGAQMLAAATLMCRQFSFRVPDPGLIATGLDATSCLPDHWTKSQCAALLTRPIFDSASYAHIRFHHRRIAEYLAGEWLNTLMQTGCPVTVLHDLLFDRVRNPPVLRSAFAAVAPWLCYGSESWNCAVRSWVLEAAPNIHFRYGDPNGLSIEYKRDILRSLANRSKGKKRIWVDSEPEFFKAFSDPAIAEDVSVIIRDRTNSLELREMMFLLVRHGQLHSCVSTALDVIASIDEPQTLKIQAAAAMRDVADIQSLHRLSEIAESIPNISNHLCAKLSDALYPRIIDAGKLIRLLEKTAPVPRYSIDLPFYLSSQFKSTLGPKDGGELLARLIELGRSPPHIIYGTEPTELSGQFYWVGEVLPTVMRKILSQTHLSQHEIDAIVDGAWFLRQARLYGNLHDEELREVNIDMIRHPNVRSAYFWRRVTEYRRLENKDPQYLFELEDHHEALKLGPADLSWLAKDIEALAPLEDRQLSLQFAIQLWNNSGRTHEGRLLIRRSARNDPSLLALYHQLAIYGPQLWLKRLWYWYIRNKLGNHFWWKDRVRQMQNWWNRLLDQYRLHRHIHRLISGKATDWLAILAHEALDSNKQQYTPTDWEGLRKKRGALLAWAARKGCRRMWRSYQPSLPHEMVRGNRTYGVIVGLAGIQAALADGEIRLDTLSYNDACLAARYAVNEINGFAPWFNDLARYHPDAVRQVFSDCIRGEWQIPAELKDKYGLLHGLVWQGNGLLHLAAPDVMKLLEVNDPPNITILRAALALLLRQPDSSHTVLEELAPTRLARYPVESAQFVLWLVVWLQFDARHAIEYLEVALSGHTLFDQVILNLCNVLKGDDIERAPLIANPDYLRPKSLQKFIPLVYRHVRPNEDEPIQTGVFTVTPRHDAEYFRGNLLDRLATSDDPEADSVLLELLNEPILESRTDLLLHLLEKRLQKRADPAPWTPADVRSFTREFEIDPKTDRDLFTISCRRLDDIRLDVEKADNSLRDELRQDDPESHLRKWLQRKLNDRSNHMYTVPQEEEIDQQQRPDLRIENPSTNPVSIEVKWAHRWSMSQLLERLENQLIGQYLRSDHSRYGIYLLGRIVKRDFWGDPNDHHRVTFEQLIQSLQQRADEIVSTRPDVERVAVIAIDFRNPREAN
jgi:hypothetical protein